MQRQQHLSNLDLVLIEPCRIGEAVGFQRKLARHLALIIYEQTRAQHLVYIVDKDFLDAASRLIVAIPERLKLAFHLKVEHVPPVR